MCGLGLWIFYAATQKWSAVRTGRGESNLELLRGHVMRVGALGCLIGTVYFVGSAILQAGCA